MAHDDFMLGEEEAAQLDQALLRYVEDTGVRAAVLMGRGGTLITSAGDSTGISLDSVCALAAGAFASSEALAKLAGEETFSSIYHQGVRAHVYVALVEPQHLLLSLFDYNASAPLVRLQARVTAEAIVAILERAAIRLHPQRARDA